LGGGVAAPEVLTTPRLQAERLGPQHLAVVAPIFADPRVGATMGGVRTEREIAAQLAEVAAAWERDGFHYWMFFETATGDPIARGGLARTVFDGAPEVEVGWTVVPGRWGEGFATELGAASIEVAFRDLALPDVVSFTLPQNVASQRVMEKLGFVYEKTAPYKIYGDHRFYRRRP
jgi:RimJ/RimL family protein N-acetyltransferase